MMALIIGFCAVAFINACTKSNNTTTTTPNNGSSFVSVTNVSAGTNAYSVYSDTSNIYTAGTLGYGSTTGVVGGNPYETIVSGSHAIKLTNGSNSIFLDSNGTFTNNGYYSFFVYDTGANIKTLMLNDNLTVPASGSAEVRFVNLTPNSTAVNLWLINTDTTTKDSVQFANSSYAGSGLITVDSLSAFKTVMAGNYKVLVNSNLELNLFSIDSITLASGKIYTLYSKGYVNGIGVDSVGVGVINNN